MKSLKFKPELIQLIRDGKKSSTWRVFDEKDLQKGEEVEFVDSETKQVVAIAVLDAVRVKPFREITEEDYDESHARYGSLDEMVKVFREYYGDRVTVDTEVKLIRFHVKEWIHDRPKVGVGVMILKGGKVLLGKRKGSHGAGEYSFPGGHLEYLESFEACAHREVQEEAGIEIGNIRFQFVSNVLAYVPKHYVHIGMSADWVSGEPENLEPEKLEGWGWYALDALPEPLFAMCAQAIRAHRTHEVYIDAT